MQVVWHSLSGFMGAWPRAACSSGYGPPVGQDDCATNAVYLTYKPFSVDQHEPALQRGSTAEPAQQLPHR